MMGKSEVQISLDVARVLEGAACAGFSDDTMAPDDILSMYDDIEKNLVAKYVKFPEIVKEIRRRVAEWKLIIFAERDFSFARINLLFKKIDTLGYSDLLLEFDIKLIYVRCCIKHNKLSEAESVLNSVRQKISRLSKTMTKKNYERWIVSIDKKIEELAKDRDT